jgi:hypothetical protein
MKLLSSRWPVEKHSQEKNTYGDDTNHNQEIDHELLKNVHVHDPFQLPVVLAPDVGIAQEHHNAQNTHNNRYQVVIYMHDNVSLFTHPTI